MKLNVKTLRKMIQETFNSTTYKGKILGGIGATNKWNGVIVTVSLPDAADAQSIAQHMKQYLENSDYKCGQTAEIPTRDGGLKCVYHYSYDRDSKTSLKKEVIAKELSQALDIEGYPVTKLERGRSHSGIFYTIYGRTSTS